MRLLVLILAAALAAPLPAAKRRAVSPTTQPARLLFVAAHPDDEVLLAPLLAQWCVRGGTSCAILVMTRGEAGTCALPGGCNPDLGSVRTAEMARAAALFNARLTQWSYSDVMANVVETWAAEAGGRDVLLLRLDNAIAAENPDTIVTFDPQHGSTCHPAHRAIGSLVLERGASHVVLLETAAQFVGDGFQLSNAAAPWAITYPSQSDWEFLVQDAENHASQFTPAQVESLRLLPESQRNVWLMPAGGGPVVSHCGEAAYRP